MSDDDDHSGTKSLVMIFIFDQRVARQEGKDQPRHPREACDQSKSLVTCSIRASRSSSP